MQADFQATLRNLQKYSVNSQPHIAQIQRGIPQALEFCIQQLIKINQDINRQPIISKILSMRFARDIMILGKHDVVQQLIKLVPYMVKVCEHHISSSDPNRGETIFTQHQEFRHCPSQEEKKKLSLYGSTYFTLCLESINRWAKWVPIDDNGNQSIYSKGYNKLLQQGVAFQNILHYYKNADTDKFKNTYKVQFFTESEFQNNSYSSSISHSSSAPPLKLNTKGQESWHRNSNNNDMGSSITLKQLQTTQQIKSYMLNSSNNKNFMENGVRRYDKIQQVYRKVLNLLQKNIRYQNDKFPSGSKFADKNDHHNNMMGWIKNQRQYLETFIVNYVLLQSKKQSYNQFIEKITKQQIQISQQSQERIDQSLNFIKVQKLNSKIQHQQTEQLLRKQQANYISKISYLKEQLLDKCNQLSIANTKKQEQIFDIRKQYQSRINLIKKGVIQNSGDKTQYLLQQNQNLKLKLNNLINEQQQHDSSDYPKQSLKYMQGEKLQFRRQIEILKIQNQKLHNTHNLYLYNNNNKILTEENQQKKKFDELKIIIRNLQQKLINKQKQLKKQKSAADKSLPQDHPQLLKLNKKLSNLTSQLQLYKVQLSTEREKHSRQQLKTKKTHKQNQIQIKDLKDKVNHLLKMLDLKDLQTAELSEQVKLCKLMDLQNHNIIKTLQVVPDKNTNTHNRPDYISQNNSSEYKLNGAANSPRNSEPLVFKYKKYETLRNTLNSGLYGSKQCWYRTAKCSLKRKQILFKQNGLEVGLITTMKSVYQMQFLIHFTNVSDRQIDNFQITCQHHNYDNSNENSQQSVSISLNKQQLSDFQYNLNTEFIFCLQSQEQEKVKLSCKFGKILSKSIYEPTYLCLHFRRNSQVFKHKLLMPYLIFKSIQTCAVPEEVISSSSINKTNQYKNQQQYYSVKFAYSSTILPQNKHLLIYFPGIKKSISKNRNKQSSGERYSGLCRIKGVDNVEFILKLQLPGNNSMKVKILPIRKQYNTNQQRLKYSQIQEQIFRDFLSFMEFAFRK